MELPDFLVNPILLFGGLIGGAFLSMASHGTDQLIVQRLLSTKNLRDGQKAIIGSGIIVIIQFAIFLLVGVMLFAYYGKLDVKSDEIFPMFIINVLPAGYFRSNYCRIICGSHVNACRINDFACIIHNA